MNLKALRQRHEALTAEIAQLTKARADIGTKAVAENRKLTDDERAQFVAMGPQIEAKQAELAENAELLAAAEAANEAERRAKPAADADADATARAAATARVEVGKNRAEDDPKKGFKGPQDFLEAVMVAGQGRKMDERLLPLRATQGSDEQGAYSDPYGGYLIPHGIAPGILSVRPEDDPIAGMTTKPPMRTPTVSFNARVDKNHASSVSGGLTVTRKPETVDAGSSRMQFEQVTLTANELWGFAFATERIITDSPESFVAIIAAGFSDEYVAQAMDERLNGTGVGEPLGILNTANGALVAVAKQTGQAADTIVKENIDNMVARCWRYSRACWCANHDTRPQLASLVQAVGTGGQPVPYLTMSPAGQELLYGKPIYFTEFAQKLGDQGDISLCVWSEYLEGEYQPMRSDESIHVRFAAGERAFRFYKRNDGKPWWRSALTPRYATTKTLSPWVTLQAR